MPSRPALPVEYQIPTNGTNPLTFGPADFDAALDLPLHFSKGELRWRRLLPFLPWADEVVARGARITYSTVSFFEIEGLLLEIADMTALRLETAIDTSIAVSAVFRIMNYIRLQGWFPSPSSSCEHFIQVVREHKLQMPPIELAVFTIRDTDIVKFVPRVAPYGLEHRWLQLWTWAKARDREDRLTTTVWTLKLLGPHDVRASLASRSIGQRLTSIAGRFGAGFIRTHTEFTFSDLEISSQVPVWVRAFKRPTELSATPIDESDALSEFLRAYRFSQASAAEKSAMVADVFDKVLVATPSLAKLAGQATPLQAYNASRPMLKVFEITPDPLLMDWQTLDGRVGHMLEIVASMPLSADFLVKKVAMIMDDENATHVTHFPRSDGTRNTGDVDGFSAGIDPTSFTLLRRSAELQAVVTKLTLELGRSKPRRNVVIKLCLRSRLSGVVRYITGALDTLHVHDMFGQITHHRAQKLHASTLDPISKALWLSVFKTDIAETPRLVVGGQPDHNDNLAVPGTAQRDVTTVL